MVHVKELRKKDLTYLAIADRETEDGSSGTRLVTRLSLRSSKSEASVVNKGCFDPETSSKFDIVGSVKWGSNNLKIYGGSKHIVGYWEWTEDVLAHYSDTLEEVRVRSFRYSFEKTMGEFETFKMAHFDFSSS